MRTSSPILDLMVDIVSNDFSGLLVIRGAGEVIAADAAFNLRMANAHGASGHGSATRMLDHMRAYEALIETAQKAWAAFKSETSRDALKAEPYEVLENALRTLRQELDALT